VSPQVVTALFAGMALLGQLVNVWLNLRIRTGQLEMRQDILEEVDRTYMRKDVYAAGHPAGLELSEKNS
jgi:hypothetical protein